MTEKEQVALQCARLFLNILAWNKYVLYKMQALCSHNFIYKTYIHQTVDLKINNRTMQQPRHKHYNSATKVTLFLYKQRDFCYRTSESISYCLQIVAILQSAHKLILPSPRTFSPLPTTSSSSFRSNSPSSTSSFLLLASSSTLSTVYSLVFYSPTFSNHICSIFMKFSLTVYKLNICKFSLSIFNYVDADFNNHCLQSCTLTLHRFFALPSCPSYAFSACVNSQPVTSKGVNQHYDEYKCITCLETKLTAKVTARSQICFSMLWLKVKIYIYILAKRTRRWLELRVQS